MAITLRATGGTSTLASGSRTNSTISKPANAATNDVIVVCLEVGGSSSTAVTAPAGWTEVGVVTYTSPDPWWVHVAIYAKVYDGAASWTWTHAARTSQAFTMALVGVDNSTMIDVAGTAAFQNDTTGGSANAVAPAYTVATVGAWGVIARGSWDGNAITPPASWTERIDVPVLWVGTREWTATGSSGTVSVPAGNNSAFAGWGVVMGAFRPASGSGSPASATGSLSLSGTAAAAVRGVASGALSLSGTAAASGGGAASATGSLALSGTAGARGSAAASGVLSLSGTAGAGARVVVPTVAVDLAAPAPVVSGRTTVTGGGVAAITITALPPTVTGSVPSSGTGTLTLSGSASAAGHTAASGVLLLDGAAGAAARTSASGTLTFSASGGGGAASAASGALVLSGSASLTGEFPASGSGTLSLSGAASGGARSGASGTVSLVGTATSRAPGVAAGSLSLIGLAASGARGVASGVLTLTGAASTTGETAVAASGVLTLTGFAGATGQSAAAAVGTLSLSGVAVLVRPPNLVRPRGSIRTSLARGTIRPNGTGAVRRDYARARIRT